MRKEKIYRFKRGLFIREVGDEVIIVSDGSIVYVLKNDGCKVVYKLLSQGVSLGNLVCNLASYLGMEKEEVEQKTRELIEVFKEADLIEEKQISLSLNKIPQLDKNVKSKRESFPVLEKINLKELVPEELIPIGCVSACGCDNFELSGYHSCPYPVYKDCQICGI